MKTCGWAGAVVIAVFTSFFSWWNHSGAETPSEPTVIVRRVANASDMTSEAGMRFLGSQPRHWRHLVMPR